MQSFEAQFKETNNFLEQYKVHYKGKKEKIKELEHDLKLNKALCEKYKADIDRFVAASQVSAISPPDAAGMFQLFVTLVSMDIQAILTYCPV